MPARTTPSELRNRFRTAATDLPKAPAKMVAAATAQLDELVDAVVPAPVAAAVRSTRATVTRQAEQAVERVSDVVTAFATDTFNRAETARVEFNGRFRPQVLAVRARATDAIASAAATRAGVDQRVEPIVDRIIERLPEQFADGVVELRKVRHDLAAGLDARAKQVVMTITEVPATKKSTTASAAKTAKTAKSAKRSVGRPATKKTSAKKSSATTSAAQKNAAKKNGAKKAARRARA
jgi:NADH dehydrogenase/NADH:ubiquinone oxidoreductase subunit G